MSDMSDRRETSDKVMKEIATYVSMGNEPPTTWVVDKRTFAMLGIELEGITALVPIEQPSPPVKCRRVSENFWGYSVEDEYDYAAPGYLSELAKYDQKKAAREEDLQRIRTATEFALITPWGQIKIRPFEGVR
jgi:hypothetical protein